MKRPILLFLLGILPLHIMCKNDNTIVCETAWEAVQNMGVGWNLGNVLEAPDGEGTWAREQVTKELIKTIKDGGFKTMRIPITWYRHIGEENAANNSAAVQLGFNPKYTVNIDFMNRLEEIVDWVLSEDLYCVINIHHDTGHDPEIWLNADLDNIDMILEQFNALWLQIADRFKHKSEKLQFEGYNEIMCPLKLWNGATDSQGKGYKAVNILAQAFVNTVRSTGSINSTRNLHISTFSAYPRNPAGASLVMPTDLTKNGKNHLIVQVHSYNPQYFTSTGDWMGTNETCIFRENLKQEIDEDLQLLKQNFLDNGYPVVIGEFGAINKRNLETGADNNTEERAKYASYVVSKARETGNIMCIWWDDSGQFRILNRQNNTWIYDPIRIALTIKNKIK